MILLKDKELDNIHGGGFGFFAALAGIVTFVIGVIDGYVRPLKCNK
jgi:hypothetical protein